MKTIITKIKAFLGLTNYTSELDQLLTGFDKTHPTLSLSQYTEKEKYMRIYQLRDHPEQIKPKKSFWDNF